jgi:GT2 family glycosyltransferase
MKIKIAVCIPAFSNAENVKNCIESIFKSNNEKFELTILLYNNSTKQDIISICKEYAFKFNNIQLQDIRCNRGCSITWNDAIEYVYHSKSNFFSSLIIINDDIQFFEDSFIYFVETVLKNPDIPIITADGYSIFSYSRYAYEKVGYFDENIRPAYFEDSDYASRIQKMNLKEMHLDLKTSHIGSASIPDNNLRKEFDEIHLPRTKGYYNKKWDNPVIFNGFPTRYLWPFDRKEESLKINYSQRKKPHPYFSTVVDIPYAFERFEEIKKNSSDINELVEDIFNHTKGCNIAVSLGIMKGDAAFALLLGCQHHISIDSNASRDTLNFLNDYFGSKSSSIIQNTYDPIDLEEFDVLFVDSAHTADCVEKELKTHAYKVNKFIIFHDTHTFGDVGEDGGEGIKKPIYDFLSNNQEWKIIYEANNNNGLIILAK